MSNKEFVKKELIKLLEDWLSDPDLEGEDALIDLDSLLSDLPAPLLETEFSIKGFLALIKGEK
jgi:hypothetical protein